MLQKNRDFHGLFLSDLDKDRKIKEKRNSKKN